MDIPFLGKPGPLNMIYLENAPEELQMSTG